MTSTQTLIVKRGATDWQIDRCVAYQPSDVRDCEKLVKVCDRDRIHDFHSNYGTRQAPAEIFRIE